jgi:hypothetical protein
MQDLAGGHDLLSSSLFFSLVQMLPAVFVPEMSVASALSAAVESSRLDPLIVSYH